MRLIIILLLLIAIPSYSSEESQAPEKKGSFLSRSFKDIILLSQAILHEFSTEEPNESLKPSKSLPTFEEELGIRIYEPIIPYSSHSPKPAPKARKSRRGF